MCEDEHMTCRDCVMDRMWELCVDDISTLKCSNARCGNHLIRPDLPVQFDEHVFIYVDDSNIWIEGKKLAAKQLNLKCVEDPRLRLDVGRVADVVANGREVAWGILYGSEPPPIDTVWEKIRERGWKVITSKRSRITNKEKQVDHQMVSDIATLVSDRAVAKGKIAIVSGDADIIPAIKEGLSKNWSFEIWMWEGGISNALKSLAEDYPESLNISPLDSRLEDISFTNFTFSGNQFNPSLGSRSAVITNVNFNPDLAWQENLSKKLSWPFQFCWIGSKSLGDPLDYVDILLIFASGVKSKDDNDFGYHFEKIFEGLQKEYPEKVVNYPAYRKKFDTKEEIRLANRYGALEGLYEELSLSSTSDQFDEDEAEGGVESKYESEPDDKQRFQVIQRQRRKNFQRYSEQCKDRSKCKKRLNCTHSHTEAEKKFFRNLGKNLECRNKNGCKYGSRCKFAHSAKDSFCCECHVWGHLQDSCTSKSS